MVSSSVLYIITLASAALAHPKRHAHHHHGTGTGSGFAMPTGGMFPMNGTTPTNGTDLGGSPVESPVATGVMTVTVRPIPLESSGASVDSGFSSVPNNVNAVSSGLPVAPAEASSSECSSVLTSTITSTSVQIVTVTAGAGTGAGASEDSGDAALPSTFGPSTSPVTPTSSDSGYGLDVPSSSGPVAPAATTDSGIAGLSPSVSISLASGTPAAGGFFGVPGGGRGGGSGGSYGAASSSMVIVPSNGPSPFPAAGVPTTFATAPSAAAASSAPASASASAPAAASSAPSTPSTGGSSGGKKGLSYNDASLTQAFAGKGISWAYNWGSGPDGSIVSGAEYVPMLWGLNSVSSWASAAASAISSGSKHALSFNEPDLEEQSNIDPQTAATNHIKYMNPLSGQAQIGSPAITNGGGSMGITWLNNFFKACNGQCKVDFVAFHWYDQASNLAYFKSHVNDVIAAAQANGVSKVWLTEFGASGSDSDVANFLTQATSFLDSTGAVERYAYFMCSNGILINGNSISSPVGAAYAS